MKDTASAKRFTKISVIFGSIAIIGGILLDVLMGISMFVGDIFLVGIFDSEFFKALSSFGLFVSVMLFVPAFIFMGKARNRDRQYVPAKVLMVIYIVVVALVALGLIGMIGGKIISGILEW